MVTLSSNRSNRSWESSPPSYEISCAIHPKFIFYWLLNAFDLSTYSPIHLFIQISIYVLIYSFIYLSRYLSKYLSIYLFIDIFIYQSNFPVCLSILIAKIYVKLQLVHGSNAAAEWLLKSNLIMNSVSDCNKKQLKWI